MEYFVNAYRFNYANFDGRARRSEYWYFILFFYLGLMLTTFLDSIFETGTVALGYGVFTSTYFILSLIPQLAIRVRRLHDTGKSGLWLLIGLVPFLGVFVLFIFMLLEGDPFENRWGPNPKGIYENPDVYEDEITSIGEDL